MSFSFVGSIIETKPGQPRQDVVPGTDGATPVDFAFYYKMYNDINKAGSRTFGFSVGDNVDLAVGQSIHSTMGYLIDFLMENRARLQRDPNERLGVILSLTVNNVKSQVVINTTAPDVIIQEGDLDQDAINLVFYVNAESNPDILEFGPGPIKTALIRLRELAREKGYQCSPEVTRLTPPIPDDSNPVEGATVTITAPTYTTTPDVAYWIKDGVTIQPLTDGAQDLVLVNVTVFDAGFYQVKAGDIPDGRNVPDQIRTSVGAQIDIDFEALPSGDTTSNMQIFVTVGGAESGAVGEYGFLAGASGFGSLLTNTVAGGVVSRFSGNSKTGITTLQISNISRFEHPALRIQIFDDLPHFYTFTNNGQNGPDVWTCNDPLLVSDLMNFVQPETQAAIRDPDPITDWNTSYLVILGDA